MKRIGRLGIPALSHQRVAQVVPRVRVARVNGERALKGQATGLCIAPIVVRDAQKQMSLLVFGPGTDQVAQQGHRRVELLAAKHSGRLLQ